MGSMTLPRPAAKRQVIIGRGANGSIRQAIIGTCSVPYVAWQVELNRLPPPPSIQHIKPGMRGGPARPAIRPRATLAPHLLPTVETIGRSAKVPLVSALVPRKGVVPSRAPDVCALPV